MTEKINVNGKDVWVVIEAQEAHPENPKSIPTEYFTAFYNLEEPGAYTSSHEPGKTPGKAFKDEKDEPKLFTSPVEAIEYAVEKLPEILNS